MLYDYYTLIKNEHDNIMKKDYVVFFRNLKGFSKEDKDKISTQLSKAHDY